MNMVLLNRSVISGYPDGKFRPERVVTRAAFAKIMVLAAGLNPVKVSKTSFSDIKPSDWEAPFVEAAKSYLNGYKQANGKLVFKPDAPATREDVAVAIVKLKGYNKTKLPDRTIIQAMFKDYNFDFRLCQGLCRACCRE
ncbi:S-layer family protein [Paenibacillus taihuensis]|uniref:S-layer family protein n=1 Tax=Paenibacillus taihuensis TaxID=1156355 RepID=A0A3D9RZ22_9BACL|nr:S-layer homology domain-containing protein [Paenibacillus taihuensis]REE85314.1 S-layer family protein [Paenibacillus taihuensis]